MWLQLPDGTTFNLNAARAIKVGSAGGDSENWALLAETIAGDDVILAEYHSPQAAQKSQDEVVQAIKNGRQVFDLA